MGILSGLSGSADDQLGILGTMNGNQPSQGNPNPHLTNLFKMLGLDVPRYLGQDNVPLYGQDRPVDPQQQQSGPQAPPLGPPTNVGYGAIGQGVGGNQSPMQSVPQFQMPPPMDLSPPDQGNAQLPPGAQPTQGFMPPQQQQQPPQQSGPGVGDRMMAGFQGFANGGAILPAIANLIGGLSTGQRQDIHPKLQKVGTDPFTGEDKFAWVRPDTQTMTPATMGAAPQGNAAAMGPSLAGFSQAVRSGVTGDALYEHLPPEMRNTVKSMIAGRSQLPSAAAMRNPQVMALINAANTIDPTFDATEWGKRSALVKNYLAGGKQFQEMQAIGTVSGHLENLAKSADAMNNWDIPAINSIKNWWLQNTGDPRVDKLGTDIQAVSNELSKAYRGGHVTEGDVREWNSKINAAKSPAQFKAVIGEFNDLLRSKRERIEEGYTQGMGKNPLPAEFTAESQRSRNSFENVAKWSGGEAQAKPAGVSGGKPLPAGTYNWTPQGGLQ